MSLPAAATTPSASSWAHALDRTGVVASVGCAVHCAVAPLLLLAAPTLGGFWVHPATHLAVAALVLPVAGLALRRGYDAHGRRWIVSLGVLGMALVLVGAFLPFAMAGADVHTGAAAGEAHACHDCCPSLAIDEATGAWSLRVPPATVLTLFGGIALVTAHLGNLRCCAGCRA